MKVRVLILGGGAGGICMAARLKKRLPAGSVAVVEPSHHHYYQPLWTLVGGGVVKKEKSLRSQAQLIPKGVEWIQDRVLSVDPRARTVTCESGKVISYVYLVVATGLQLDFAKIQGLPEALGKDGVHTIYTYEGSERTAQALEQFQGGTALFTMPPVPIKCAGAPQKIMYLADEWFRKKGIREKTTIIFATAGQTLFGVPVFAEALTEVAGRKAIQVRFAHRLVQVKAAEKLAVFEVAENDHKQMKEIPYDFLHAVPPMSAHPYIRESGLAYEEGPHAGWLKVDRHTLRHHVYPNIFGVGDVTGVPNSKTGAAIRKQAPVVAGNLMACIQGQALPATYDGYSSCPLVTGYGKVILAEFGYEGKLLPSFPLRPTKERLSMWWLKRYLLSPLYWRGMLKGWA